MSIKTICAGIGALALIGGLAACGSAVAPAAAPAVHVTQTVTPEAAPTVTKTAVPAPVVTKTVTPVPVRTVYVAPPAPAALTQPGWTNCTGGTDEADTIWAGPNTSCPFALNVAAAFPGGPGVAYVYSSVTGQTYGMTYLEMGAGTVIATGGNNASVEF